MLWIMYPKEVGGCKATMAKEEKFEFVIINFYHHYPCDLGRVFSHRRASICLTKLLN